MTLKAKLTPEYLEEALNRGGKTEVIIAKEQGCSRQRVHQLFEGFGFVRQKTPEWYARYYGKPELANKEWFKKELKRAGGVIPLSRKIKISRTRLKFQVERLNMDLSQITYHAKKVILVCHFCGAEIQRKESQIREDQKYFFCNKICQGKWLGTNFGRAPDDWPEEMDEFIRLHYQEMPDVELAEKLGKTLHAVKKRRLEVLHLKKRPYRRWTKKEYVFLKAHYLQMGDKEIGKQIDRTWGAVAAARHKRGLRKQGKLKLHFKHFKGQSKDCPHCFERKFDIILENV